jgi:hypothetical protein
VRPLTQKQVIHNPGTVPDARFNDTKPDITVVFEHDYQSWMNEKRASIAALPPARPSFSLMVHTMPKLDNATLADFVNGLSEVAEHLFITSNAESFYEKFADDWLLFIDRVPA